MNRCYARLPHYEVCMRSLPPVFVAIVFVVIGLLGCGGCAFLRGSAAGTAFVDPGQRHLLLPGLTGADPAASAYRAPFEYQEYARSQTDGRTEALFMRTKSLGTALDMQPLQLESYTRRWAFNGGAQKLDWLQPRQSRVAGTDIRYRRYRRAAGKPATARECVAFMRTWGRDSLDPLLRPGRGYFGYHCATPDTALSDTAAQHYLRRITIADLPLLGFHIGQAVPRDARAGKIANAHADPHWGFAPFPFGRTRHYPIGASTNGGY